MIKTKNKSVNSMGLLMTMKIRIITFSIHSCDHINPFLINVQKKPT